MKGIQLLICAALLCLCGLARAEEFSGKVIAVIDGDTLLVLRDGRPVKVRLAEIDAPEKAQPFGMAAQKSLSEMVKGEKVKVVSNAVDDYGRLVGHIYVGEFNVNNEQVRRGMAWEYSRFHSNKELMALQQEAQRAKRGLWAEANPIEPSQWRKQHPDASAKQRGASASPDHAPTTSTPPGDRATPAQDCHKRHCSEMSSCEEAMHYFKDCGRKALDGNGDGVPCEALCSAAGSNTLHKR